MSVPVILNNRNLVTWPSRLVEQIKKLDDVGEIIVLDNDSSAPAVLDWYDKTDVRVERLSLNLGHRAPWISGLVNELCDAGANWYIVTDPDLDLEGVPRDAISRLIEACEANRMRKVGLSLDWTRANRASPWWDRRRHWEVQRIELADLGLAGVVKAPVDTTFAVWSDELRTHAIEGGMLWAPYRARHIPWEYTVDMIKADPEFSYYMAHANESCSLKALLGIT